jgi:small subunit ribosomal protein S20
VAIHKDALKRAKQNEKRRLRNKDVRTFYRNRIKAVRAAIEAEDLPTAEDALKKAIRAIDGAVSKNVLHKNTASRYKSRLSRAVAGLKGSGKSAQA